VRSEERALAECAKAAEKAAREGPLACVRQPIAHSPLAALHAHERKRAHLPVSVMDSPAHERNLPRVEQRVVERDGELGQPHEHQPPAVRHPPGGREPLESR
jgi:hypothetical protein